MIDRLTSRPLVQRGLGIATAGLLVAGTFLAPAVARAASDPPHAIDDVVAVIEDTFKIHPDHHPARKRHRA